MIVIKGYVCHLLVLIALCHMMVAMTSYIFDYIFIMLSYDCHYDIIQFEMVVNSDMKKVVTLPPAGYQVKMSAYWKMKAHY